MSATNEGHETRTALGLGAAFAAIALLGALDLAGDLLEGAASWHVMVEAGVTAVGLAGGVWAARRFRALAARARALEARTGELASRLDESRREAERWRAEARDLIEGLAAAIDSQLERWGLSPAEKDVALLLLKGLSHKEIADVRGTGEATVRQQSRAIYKKAGLGGRHDLAAFFLEDLLGARPEPRDPG